MKERHRLRLLLTFAVALVFVGLVVFSVLGVRYSVQGAEKDELYITERSLTHGIERGADGRLITTAPPAATGETGKTGEQAEPCPT